jgi:hypothetical protein
VEVVTDNEGVRWLQTNDGLNVGVYVPERTTYDWSKRTDVVVASEWVVLPEDKADWRVPAEAKMILDEENNPVVFGAGSRIWKYTTEGRWVTDLSEVDTWALTDWLYQVAEEALGPVEKMEFPRKHSYFYELNKDIFLGYYDGYFEGKYGFSYRLNAWFSQVIAIRESDNPDEAFYILTPVIHDKWGQPHRLIVLGFVEVDGRPTGVHFTYYDKELGGVWSMPEPDLERFKRFYPVYEKGQDVVVWLNYAVDFNDDAYELFGLDKEFIKDIYQQIFNGNVPEDLALIPENTMIFDDAAVKK